MWISPICCIRVAKWIREWYSNNLERYNKLISMYSEISPENSYFKDDLESKIRDNLSLEIDGKTEIICLIGKIDIVSDEEIIEVKHINKWKHALGQINAYGSLEEFKNLRKRIHLFGKDEDNKNIIIRICKTFNIEVTFE